MIANCSIIFHCETYQKRKHESIDTRVAPISYVYILRGVPDKSLAQPGTKQATATKPNSNILPTKLNTLLSPLF